MNIQKFKTGIVWTVVCVVLICGAQAARYYFTEEKSWDQRFYSQYPKLTWEDRLKLHKELSQELSKPITSSYKYVELLKQLELLTQAEKRNFNVEAEPAPKEIAKHYYSLPTTGMLLFDLNHRLHEMQQNGISNSDFLWAQRDLAQRGITSVSDSTASMKAGKFNWSGVLLWLGILLLGFKLCTILMATGRALERKFPLLLLPFDPDFWLAITLSPRGIVKYMREQDVTKRVQRALSVAGGVIASALPFGGAVKVFGQDKKTKDEQGEKDTTLLVTQPKNWSFSYEQMFASEYHGHFVGAIFHRGKVMSSMLSVTHNKSGLSFGIWTSKSLSNRMPNNFGDEVDWFAGWNGKLKGVNVSGGFNVINARPLSQVPKGDVLVLDLRLGKSFKQNKIHDFELFEWTRYSTPLQKGGPERGWVFEAGAVHNFTLHKRVSAGATTSILADTGPYGFNPGMHLNLDASLRWKVSNHLTLVAPSGKYTVPLTRSGDGRHPVASVSAGFRITF